MGRPASSHNDTIGERYYAAAVDMLMEGLRDPDSALTNVLGFMVLAGIQQAVGAR